MLKLIIEKNSKHRRVLAAKEKRRPRKAGDAKGKDDISREALRC